MNGVECHNDIEVPIGNNFQCPLTLKDFLDWVRILEEEEDDKLSGTDFSSTGQSKYSVSNLASTNVEHSKKTLKKQYKKLDVATPKKDEVAFRPWKTLPNISRNAVDAQKYRKV